MIENFLCDFNYYCDIYTVPLDQYYYQHYFYYSYTFPILFYPFSILTELQYFLLILIFSVCSVFMVCHKFGKKSLLFLLILEPFVKSVWYGNVDIIFIFIICVLYCTENKIRDRTKIFVLSIFLFKFIYIIPICFLMNNNRKDIFDAIWIILISLYVHYSMFIFSSDMLNSFVENLKNMSYKQGIIEKMLTYSFIYLSFAIEIKDRKKIATVINYIDRYICIKRMHLQY